MKHKIMHRTIQQRAMYVRSISTQWTFDYFAPPDSVGIATG